GAVEIAGLLRIMPNVSPVTLRRDMTELAEAGALKRTHGGAVLPDAAILKHPAAASPKVISGVDDMDAVVLPPVVGKGGEALRRHIARRGIPFLAESAPQVGGVYLGPDNYEASNALGRLAGEECQGMDEVRILIIGEPQLENTIARAKGFEEGFRLLHRGLVTVVTINGQGSYRAAMRVTTDAFASSEPFDVIFSVNDHSAVAGAEVAAKQDADVKLYVTGGESPDFVGQLADDGPLRAVAAFFPEVVGATAVDRIARALAEGRAPDGSVTPHALITADNLNNYYIKTGDGWQLRAQMRKALMGRVAPRVSRPTRPRIGIMPHFPAHAWYRSLIQAMQARAAELKFEIVVTPPHQGISAEISRLRIEIAKLAAAELKAGETIVLGAGEATHALALEINGIAHAEPSALAGLTVITNALDILHTLENTPGIKTILTSGEYQSADRCLVGPSVGALFDRVRADRAYLAVAGISHRFGASALDERLALAASRLGNAARKTIILADHTIIGAEANHRIARIEELDTVYTDDGTLAADRQSLRAAGLEVLVSGDVADTQEPQISQARILHQNSPLRRSS
ncbi:MAG: substrate-binding domain-containing protein, partial [Pseudomonadota bacterium]